MILLTLKHCFQLIQIAVPILKKSIIPFFYENFSFQVIKDYILNEEDCSIDTIEDYVGFINHETKSYSFILYYNYGKFVSNAIYSVLNQTYQKFEILVIDDGSTDNSLEIISKYSKDVTIIKQKNIGLVKSILKVFSIAKGDYVIRLDADDWLDSKCIEMLVKKIETNKNVAMVFPDYFEVDEFGQTIRRIRA